MRLNYSQLTFGIGVHRGGNARVLDARGSEWKPHDASSC